MGGFGGLVGISLGAGEVGTTGVGRAGGAGIAPPDEEGAWGNGGGEGMPSPRPGPTMGRPLASTGAKGGFPFAFTPGVGSVGVEGIPMVDPGTCPGICPGSWPEAMPGGRGEITAPGAIFEPGIAALEALAPVKPNGVVAAAGASESTMRAWPSGLAR